MAQNGLSVNDISKHSLLCSNHFDLSLFVNHGGRRRLLKNAVPSTIIKKGKHVSLFLQPLQEIPIFNIV